MKNQPKNIYLVVGADGECEDFEELVGVSWCEDRINDDDLEYISVSFIPHRIKELIATKEKIKNNPMASKAEYKAICKNIDPLINELKKLIE
jgi:hypothetical protein